MGCSSSNVEKLEILESDHVLNRKCEYFTLKGESISGIKGDAGPSQKIEFFFFIKNVEFAKYSMEIEQTIEDTSYEIGKTKEFEGTNIDFMTSFAMNYYFEKEQILNLKVKKNQNVIVFKYAVGKLMGSQGQIAIIPFYLGQENSGSLILQAQNIKDDNYESVIKVLLYARDKSTNLDPYFFLKRDISSPDHVSHVNAYKSEVLNNQTNNYYDFQKITIRTLYLNNNINTKPFLIDFHDALNKTVIGYQKVEIDNFSKLNGFKIKYNLLSNTEHKLLNAYELTITIEKLQKLHRFIDYLRGGLQISMILGIDFTSSNMQVNDPNSLHYIHEEGMNAYEKAISACGKIVSYYDYDQMFPVFGYGAVLQDSEQVNHCFAINFHDEDPNINTIANINKTYRECLRKIQLYGPTYFSPIIKKAIEITKSTSNDKNVYYILMILTDGQINDMNPTIDLLVEASNLALSIIIIGIGEGPFGNMEKLDADINPLFNTKGKKAHRDIVQFVEFRKFENNGTKLAEEVLEEIPGQVESYCRMIDKAPNDPINLDF
jgi:hypothetical protein